MDDHKLKVDAWLRDWQAAVRVYNNRLKAICTATDEHLDKIAPLLDEAELKLAEEAYLFERAVVQNECAHGLEFLEELLYQFCTNRVSFTYF